MAQRGPHPLLLVGGLTVVLALAAGAWLMLQSEEPSAPPGGTRVVRPSEPAPPAPRDLPEPAEPRRTDPVPEPEPLALARLSGRLLHADRRPASGGEVELMAGESLPLLGIAGLQRLGPAAVADTEGRFLVAGVPPGTSLTLRARGDDFAPTDSGPYVVAAGEQRDLGDLIVTEGLTVQGLVHDAQGRGIAGAQVALADGPVLSGSARPARVVLTDEAGRYTLHQAPRMPFLLVASAPGYGNASAKGGSLEDDGTTQVEISLLLEKSTSLRGRLVSTEGEPLGDTEVVAIPRVVGRAGCSAVTDAAGRFELVDLVAGDYRVEADAVGYGPTDRAVTAADFDRDDAVLLEARPAGVVAGQVVDPQGQPVVAYDMLVRFSPNRNAPGSPWGQTQRVRDAEGRFEVGDLLPGWYSFELWARGFALTTTEPTRVKSGQRVAGLTLSLQEGARLAGLVLSDDGRPVAGARVSLHADRTAQEEFLRSKAPREPWQAETTTDGTGAFELAGVSPRRYQVEVDHGDFPVQRRDGVEAIPGELTEVEPFTLVRSAALRGFALGAGGQPAPRVLVLLKGPPGVPSRQARTDGSGAYHFERLPPGSYALRATGGGQGFDSVLASVQQLKEPGTQARIELSPGQQGVLNVSVGG